MKLDDWYIRYIIKRLLNVYCEIVGTRSYGGDALASSCVLPHMNSCRIFQNIHSITYEDHSQGHGIQYLHEVLPEIHTMEKYDMFNFIFHSQIIQFSVICGVSEAVIRMRRCVKPLFFMSQLKNI